MLEISSSGSFSNTEKFLKRASKPPDVRTIFNSAGRRGLVALQNGTPKRTGLAADSWYYEVEHSPGLWKLTWYNSNIENGFPVAVMIQHGHGTGTGGYVAGIDYINPALRPVFEDIAESIWKAVTRS